MSISLFSKRCPVCYFAIDKDKPICSDCASKLKIFTAFCLKCGYPLDKAGYECDRCRDKMVKSARRVYSTYAYCDVVRKLMLAIKFHYNIYSAIKLKNIILMPKMDMNIYDAIIPVPTHFIRRFRRFYHPTDIIAKYISDVYDIKLDYALQRSRYTDFQFKLSKDKRCSNVKEAFRYISSARYKNVLLVDDIITTGSTLEECASLLKSNGVRHVDCYTLCKA